MMESLDDKENIYIFLIVWKALRLLKEKKTKQWINACTKKTRFSKSMFFFLTINHIKIILKHNKSIFMFSSDQGI